MQRHIITFTLVGGLCASPLAFAQAPEDYPEEELQDTDNDGVPDHIDDDYDNDGIPDSEDSDPYGPPMPTPAPDVDIEVEEGPDAGQETEPVQPEGMKGGDTNVNVNVQTDPSQQPSQTTQVVVETEEEEDELWSKYGVSGYVGGGVGGFLDEDMRDMTGTAGVWEGRLAFGTRLPVAIEAAYVGSLQSIDALGLDNDADLLGTTVEGALRLNILPDAGWQPYIFGGLGWTRYDLTNAEINTSSVEEDDDLLSIPFGLGASFRIQNFVLDVRGTIRPTVGEDMVPEIDLEPGDSSIDAQSMDSWNVAARIGFEF